MTDHLFDLNFPEVYPEPLANAVIRQTPEDFLVIEDLGYSPSGEGEHCFIWVEKREANTEWVAEQFAQRLDMKKRDVSYAGRKDRHAVTRQWFSLWLPGRETPQETDLQVEGTTILGINRHHKKLRRGSHQGNEFVIWVRELISPMAQSQLKSSVDERLREISEQGFPNYFGPQRFGHDGQNLQQAVLLIDSLLTSGEEKRRRGGRGDMFISAARSYLFNHVLAERIRDGSWQNDDDQARPLTGPLLGLIRKPHPLDEWENHHLEKLSPGVFRSWQKCFQQLGMRASRRQLRIQPSDMTWEWQGDDLRLSFYLPTGSYATALIEQLFVLQ